MLVIVKANVSLGLAFLPRPQPPALQTASTFWQVKKISPFEGEFDMSAKPEQELIPAPDVLYHSLPLTTITILFVGSECSALCI